MHVFALGALDLHSTEPFPELAPASPRADAVVVALHVAAARRWAPAPAEASRLGAPDAPGGALHVLAASTGLGVWFADDAQVQVRGLVQGTRRVEVDVIPVPDLPASTVRHLVLDQVLPRIAFQLGACAVHAGGAVLDGRAVVVVGASGAGKSTFVAACAAAGARVLSDDTLLLERSPSRAPSAWIAQAWYPSLRLGEASHSAVLPTTGRGEPIRRLGWKHRLLLAPGEHAESAPLGLVLSLQRGTHARCELQRLSTGEAVTALARSMLRLVPHDSRRGVQELDELSDLLAQHGVWRLVLADDLQALAEPIRLIRTHLATAQAAT